MRSEDVPACDCGLHNQAQWEAVSASGAHLFFTCDLLAAVLACKVIP